MDMKHVQQEVKKVFEVYEISCSWIVRYVKERNKKKVEILVSNKIPDSTQKDIRAKLNRMFGQKIKISRVSKGKIESLSYVKPKRNNSYKNNSLVHCLVTSRC